MGPGDVLIGLPSAGLHTNGYSLARRILFERLGLGIDSSVKELGGRVGEILLAPHRSYLSAVRPLLAQGLVKGMAHITGGGITDNLPRILPRGVQARIDRSAWAVPPIFRFLQEHGAVSDEEMLRAFNMGIGLIAACAPQDEIQAHDTLRASGESPVTIGVCEPGTPHVEYVNG